MAIYENPFHEPGGYSLAPLSTHQWLAMWRALRNPDDDAQMARATNALGALVQPDWLDSQAPVPDEGHDSDVLADLFAAHDQHEDDWIAQQCEFAVSSVERLRSSERPYRHQDLESTARSLVSLAGHLFTVARDREEEIERGDRADA